MPKKTGPETVRAAVVVPVEVPLADWEAFMARCGADPHHHSAGAYLGKVVRTLVERGMAGYGFPQG